MHPIRLIAMDMDGTLLTRVTPGQAAIPPENASVLRRCADMGISLALASGRMPDDAGFFVTDAGLPMHIIGLNGSVILESPGGEPLWEQHLPEALARRALPILLEHGLDAVVFGTWETASVQPRPLEWAQLTLGTFFGRKGGRLCYHSGCHWDQLLPRAGKLVALTDHDRDALTAARNRILHEFPEASVTSSWWSNFEINPAGADKGAALTRLAAHLGIPMSQVMAIGDNDNDVPMLRAAGVSVAMGNATDSARSAADYLTLPNDQHGVAAAIRAIVLGENIPGVVRLK